jgi:cytochrome c oxidase cbb3-type subunit III
MYACKKIIINIFGYLILIINTVAANHLVGTSEVSLGKKIYHDRCEVCHGSQGDGKTFAANALYPIPKNFTVKVTKKELTYERMIESITRGRPGTAMMPWEGILSKQEIHSVVNYIQQKLMGL